MQTIEVSDFELKMIMAHRARELQRVANSDVATVAELKPLMEEVAKLAAAVDAKI
jgi:DNA-directed RNA polymerase subunit K/omega